MKTELEFRVSSTCTHPAYIRAASLCTVCGRMVDEVEVVHEPQELNPMVIVRCHGESWAQRWSHFEFGTVRITVPPTPRPRIDAPSNPSGKAIGEGPAGEHNSHSQDLTHHTDGSGVGSDQK